MFKKVMLVFALVSLVTVSAATGQDSDKPLIAILGDGWFPSFEVTEGAVLDMLQSYGFISADENTFLETRADLKGEKVEIFWVRPGQSYADLSVAVENALDRSPDVMLTFSSWLTEVAVNVTRDMDDPPAILFGAVEYPELYGIADSPCVKPEHVTGAESLAEYDYVLSLLKIQYPNLTKIGTMYNTGEEGGRWGADEIAGIAGEHGMEVEAVGVVRLADISVAAEALIDTGIGAFVLPWDFLTAQGLPVIAIVANGAGIPVFHPSMGAIYYGATIGAGFYTYYEDGVIVGRMLVAYLNGELDIAETAISVQSSEGLGVNLDAAHIQGIDVADEIMAQVDAVIKGGELTDVSPELQLALAREGVIVPMEDRIDSDRAFLAELDCTEERIAYEKGS